MIIVPAAEGQAIAVQNPEEELRRRLGPASQSHSNYRYQRHACLGPYTCKVTQPGSPGTPPGETLDRISGKTQTEQTKEQNENKANCKALIFLMNIQLNY